VVTGPISNIDNFLGSFWMDSTNQRELLLSIFKERNIDPLTPKAWSTSMLEIVKTQKVCEIMAKYFMLTFTPKGWKTGSKRIQQPLGERCSGSIHE
jgi:hypothetical protein